ncbi:MAG TPA: Lrp/AsnC family transcriptional regulator [Anaerolineales bacterium]|nr:Lrp/AsnC family transcriptional regulator [Anaerolineales bacterium]
MSEIDIIDVKIVDLLMENGRMNAAEIARQVGDITERAVRYRIKRMEREGVIRICAIPNPKSIGFSVIADVFIEVESSQILEVAQKLVDMECISYVACSIGEKDISAQIIAHNSDEVYAIVTEVIGKVKGVRKTTTSIVPLVLKDVYEWRIPR